MLVASLPKTTFENFSLAVMAKFDEMSKGELFVTDCSKDELWELYLKSFPEGSNPMYKERTEHDCNCCKQFIRNIGNVVAIKDGKMVSVWDVDVQHPYDIVADELKAATTSKPIRSIFRSKESRYGKLETLVLEGGVTKGWHHFEGKVSTKHQTGSPGEQQGEYKSAVDVFLRGLEELDPAALTIVSELIMDNMIYRGAEFKEVITAFRGLQVRYNNSQDKELFVWDNAKKKGARIRNSTIGTLLQDLSSGVEVDKAVKSFEAKVAPANYKRPKALISPRMVKDAMKLIEKEGLEGVLQRRYAKISDVSVNNVLFVNNDTQLQMKGGIEGLLMEEVSTTTPSLDQAESITADDFLSNVVPKSTSIEILLQNSMLGNFVSITAANIPGGGLFKWDNDFAWSYDGGVADSIKQRVKKAGGNVAARVRTSLAWYNTDDLDIWVFEPNGNKIHYGNKCGKLDVDMNAGGRKSRTPVENVCWNNHMQDGTYSVVVHNYCKREDQDLGFEVEFEADNISRNYTYHKGVRNNEKISVFSFEVVDNKVVSATIIDSGVEEGSAQQDKWGVTTESLVRVNTLMLSPNHWDDNEEGNKHWFFILDKCNNPNSTRGIYNEFLKPKFEKHRKVFEILGDKTKCPPQEEQLSGVGFSSTRKDKVTVLAKGPKLNKVYTIVF